MNGNRGEVPFHAAFAPDQTRVVSRANAAHHVLKLFGQETESTTMTEETDPQTARFIETVFFVAVLLAVHLAAFVVARYSMDLLGGTYLGFVCLILPLVSVVASIVLRSLRRWHWGQVAFVVFVSLLISFIQLLIIDSACAAV